MFVEQLIQSLAVLARIAPAAQTSGTVYASSPVDMSVIRRALLIINVGVFPSGTAIASWYAANNVAFTTAGTAFSGAASNTTTQIGTTNLTFSLATRVEKFEVRSDQLPSGTRWAQPQISVSSGAAPLFGCIVLGSECGYKPANQFEPTGFASGTTGSQIVDQSVAIGV